MRGINLIERSFLEEESKRKIRKRVTVYSLIILISFAVLNFFVFLFNQQESRKLRDLNLEINKKKDLIKNFGTREIKYQILSEKIKVLTLLLKENKKEKIPSLLDFFNRLEQNGVKIETINITQEKIFLTGSVSNADSFSSVIFLLVEDLEGKKFFRSVTLTNLSQGEKGGFHFTFNLFPNI